MRRLMVLLAFMVVASPAFAQNSVPAAGQPADSVETRLARLEARVAELEHALGPVMAKLTTDAAVARNRTAARARMEADLKVYSREDLQQIEQLYQVANRKFGSDEARTSLQTLLERYDRANRTGCALLYLGQMTEGAEGDAYLKRAIEQHGDCYYGDGVQVGPFARWVLAARERAAGRTDVADQLVEQIRTSWPDAIGHNGRLLLPTSTE
jgi:hypothetical protein